MKPFITVAALLVVLQAPAHPPQTPAIIAGPLGAEPLLVLNAERAWNPPEALWPLVSDSFAPDVRRAAVRAIGRAESSSQVAALIGIKGVAVSWQAAAIAQSLYGFDPASDPGLLRIVEEWMRVTASQGRTIEERMTSAASVAAPMSHIAYADPVQVQDVASMLRALADFSANSIKYGGLYGDAIRGLEALSRVNRKLIHYDDETTAILSRCVRNVPLNAGPSARLYALMALSTAGGLAADVEEAALKDDDWQVRRAATAVLGGAGAGEGDERRPGLIRERLGDQDSHVRLEAARAWGRRAAASEGCQPLVDLLSDADRNVVLQAIDLLGDLCRDNVEITTRLEAEVTVPPTIGPWQRGTRAFVALAKRSPEKAAAFMQAFTTHPVWWVRMYAAFAAGDAKDVPRLDKLVYDDNDNVREAALNHLRALDPERAAPAVMAALERTDVQLVRTAAGMAKESPANRRYVKPLIASLERLTKDRRMTSRDGRLALLDAIERHGVKDDHTDLVPWLRDFDPVIAQRAADAIFHLSGKPLKPEPIAQAHMPTQPFNDLRQCVLIDISNGHPIRLKMRPDLAPIAVEQFLKLATVDRYYNGLAFHRIVPNFVVQGGSPNANEYSGSAEYMRDEIAGSNVRGTVGLSTRGRNTGDAQFFVNLVDNPRLDGNYTVFATVLNMDAVDGLEEGDVMRAMTMQSCR